MKKNNYTGKILAELQAGMSLSKCKKCGCMKETLETLRSSIRKAKNSEFADLKQKTNVWTKQLKPVQYSCLGCKHCYAAEVANLIESSFSIENASAQLCDPNKKEEDKWPPEMGEYYILNSTSPVAVSTLGNVDLTEILAKTKPSGLAIVGKTETENIGIEKIIKNVISNPAIKFLILAGEESKGHDSGATILALSKNGVDPEKKIIDAPGRRPILMNVSLAEIESFRKQIQIIDMRGCLEKEVVEKINDLSKTHKDLCGCKKCDTSIRSINRSSSAPKIMATKTVNFRMDKAGYFVIIPSFKKKTIIVEHYSYDNKMLNIIEGENAPTIYQTIIENKWVSELSHAAYLGRELAKAEFSLKTGSKFVQDKAYGEEIA